MTELEKMRAGEWYDANFDKELLSQRLSAEKLCFSFNSSMPGSDEQTAALRDILAVEIPEGLSILSPVYFDYGYNTHFSKGTFVNHGCYFMDGAEITLGENVFVGPFCGFYTATHPLQYQRRNKGIEQALPIKVGNHCWFGANVSVMPGVTIGNGCVIAAGSIVVNDIPDDSMVAGVPAVIKKHIEQQL